MAKRRNGGRSSTVPWKAVAALGLATLLALQFLGGESDGDHTRILAAIRQVESGGDPDPPDGDGGRAIGPYQIHRVYWQDAAEAEPALRDAGYESCRDRAFAERVIAAYMKRYVPEAWANANAEVIARTHNGGPRGARRDATLPYWRKVRTVLEERR